MHQWGSLGLVMFESVSYLKIFGVWLTVSITAGYLLLAINSRFIREMVINKWLFLGLSCSLILILVVILDGINLSI